MSQLLNSNQTGMTSEQLKKMREETQKKWDSLGFLEGLQGHVKENIALVYEGQASCLLEESPNPEPHSFDIVAFPAVRRAFMNITYYKDEDDLSPQKPKKFDL